MDEGRKLTPHGDRAANDLHAAMEHSYEPILHAVQAFGAAAIAMREQGDIRTVMSRCAQFVRTMEWLVNTADQCHQQARDALRDVMVDAGATSLDLGDCTAYLRNSVPGAHIVNEALLPKDVWHAPRPDRQEIAKRMRAGEEVPGAVLGNAGPQSLVFRSKKEVSIAGT